MNYFFIKESDAMTYKIFEKANYFTIFDKSTKQLELELLFFFL